MLCKIKKIDLKIWRNIFLNVHCSQIKRLKLLQIFNLAWPLIIFQMKSKCGFRFVNRVIKNTTRVYYIHQLYIMHYLRIIIYINASCENMKCYDVIMVVCACGREEWYKWVFNSVFTYVHRTKKKKKN